MWKLLYGSRVKFAVNNLRCENNSEGSSNFVRSCDHEYKINHLMMYM